jgi:hypothetical protein
MGHTIDDVIPLLLLSALAAAAWSMVPRREARPLAIGLGIIVLMGALRCAPMPPRVSMALALAQPCASAAMSWTILGRPWPWSPRWLVGLVVWSMFAGVAREAPAAALWWGVLPALAWAGAVGAEVLIAASWWRMRREASLVEATALLLVGGDVAALTELVTITDPASHALAQWTGWVTWSLTAALGCAAWRR